jgi:hypothetical protein
MYLGRIVEIGSTEEIFIIRLIPIQKPCSPPCSPRIQILQRKGYNWKAMFRVQSTCHQDALSIHGVDTINRTNGLSA